VAHFRIVLVLTTIPESQKQLFAAHGVIAAPREPTTAAVKAVTRRPASANDWGED
jgi:hypothetical protein